MDHAFIEKNFTEMVYSISAARIVIHLSIKIKIGTMVRIQLMD
jgi:hypothetical protein